MSKLTKIALLASITGIVCLPTIATDSARATKLGRFMETQLRITDAHGTPQFDEVRAIKFAPLRGDFIVVGSTGGVVHSIHRVGIDERGKRYASRSRTGNAVDMNKLRIYDGVDLRPDEATALSRAWSALSAPFREKAADPSAQLTGPKVVRPTVLDPYPVTMEALIARRASSEQRQGALMNLHARAGASVQDDGTPWPGQSKEAAENILVADCTGVPLEVAGVINGYAGAKPARGLREKFQLHTLTRNVWEPEMRLELAIAHFEMVNRLAASRGSGPSASAAASEL